MAAALFDGGLATISRRATRGQEGSVTRGQEGGATRGREGGAMRVRGNTTNKMMRGRCNERMMRGEVRRQDGGVTRGRESSAEDKRAMQPDDERSQVYNSTYTAL